MLSLWPLQGSVQKHKNRVSDNCDGYSSHSVTHCHVKRTDRYSRYSASEYQSSRTHIVNDAVSDDNTSGRLHVDDLIDSVHTVAGIIE